MTTKSKHPTNRPEDCVLFQALEQVIIDELDRQFLDGEIQDGATESAYFDAVDGDVTGRPDFYKVAQRVAQALWDEEGR
jgi:hypothetical protein